MDVLMSTLDESKLLPQLWPRGRVIETQQQMQAAAPGIMIPHCALDGNDTLPAGPAGDIAVVVCWVDGNSQTTVLSAHLQVWGLTYLEALRVGE